MDYTIMEQFEHDTGEEWGKPNITIGNYAHVSLLDDGDTYSLSGLSAYDIRDCELTLNPFFDVTRLHYPPTRTEFVEDANGFFSMVSEPEYKGWINELPLHKGVHEVFSLAEVIRTLIMDLTFYGLGSTRSDFFDTLDDRVSKVKK